MIRYLDVVAICILGALTMVASLCFGADMMNEANTMSNVIGFIVGIIGFCVSIWFFEYAWRRLKIKLGEKEGGR